MHWVHFALHVLQLAHPSNLDSNGCVNKSNVVLQGAVGQNTKQKEGRLTGTNADLRRLKVPALREKLRQWGVDEATIAPLTRWMMVDLLRHVFCQFHI